MAETIPGGAYVLPDGKTWVNAKGEPLTKEQRAQAQALHAEHALLVQMEEEDRVTRAVKNDPMAQVLARALSQPAAPVAQPQPDAPKATPQKARG